MFFFIAKDRNYNLDYCRDEMNTLIKAFVAIVFFIPLLDVYKHRCHKKDVFTSISKQILDIG